MRKIFILFTVLIIVGFCVQTVLAAGPAYNDLFPDPIRGGGTSIVPTADVGATMPLPSADLMQGIVPQAIRLLLMLTGTASFIIFVYAGVMLVIAQGNEQEVTKFKNIVIWSMVGLVFIITAYALVSGIMQISFT